MDKILICDNTVQNTELISQCLMQQGYQTLSADNGFGTLAKAQLFTPDLIILDTELSDLSSYDICKRLRENPSTKYILVLFLCSFETPDSKIKAIEAGADDIIEKTFDIEFLLVKVASLLRIKHLNDKLQQQYKDLEEKNKLLDFQLKMSQKVQQALMKEQDLSLQNLQIKTRYCPALDIGGDFYEIIPLDDYNTAVVIGDVSGHGISAALLTAMINLMIKNTCMEYTRPDLFLYHMNNGFYDIFENSNHEMYACMFYAVFNTKDKTISYGNAGQVLPLFIDSTHNIAFELQSSGMPIGLMKNSEYEYQIKTYEKDNLLLMYTDGLVDALYKQNPEDFGTDIKQLLLSNQQVESLGTLTDLILNNFCAVDTSEAERYALDDISIVLCRLL